MKEVKRQAKTDEYIVLTCKCYSFDEPGDILQVSATMPGVAIVTNNPHIKSRKEYNWIYPNNCYKVLEDFEVKQ